MVVKVLAPRGPERGVGGVETDDRSKGGLGVDVEVWEVEGNTSSEDEDIKVVTRDPDVDEE